MSDRRRPKRPKRGARPQSKENAGQSPTKETAPLSRRGREKPKTTRSGTRRPAAASGHAAGPHAPLVINGWAIYVWPAFRDRWLATRARVEELRRQDPINYRSSRDAKFFKVIADLVLREIPAAPDAKEFRQGNTMGGAYIHWRRAKFMGRFRLFFRYHSKQRIIVYAWLNDEHTLRKAGASTDMYSVFRHMLERGTPPTDWNELVAACENWSSEATEG